MDLNEFGDDGADEGLGQHRPVVATSGVASVSGASVTVSTIAQSPTKSDVEWEEWLSTGEDPEDVAVVKRCKNRALWERRNT